MTGTTATKGLRPALALAAGLLVASTPGYSENPAERSLERQDSRDTRQIGRQQARQGKQDCKAGDEKSRSECRQDKRDTKQDARGTAKDIKRN
ncbi:hypothetical protein [Methylotetracoccus oryzae]|uniref:hypothetical protein n=1 Tax=Methylotetracoccus oryzae TaxID=1919059 RepID=UPI00111BAABD|nr:hypothetical protein [Methylotetracoccus oryzae]